MKPIVYDCERRAYKVPASWPFPGERANPPPPRQKTKPRPVHTYPVPDFMHQVDNDAIF
jgi:hypothetical protein